MGREKPLLSHAELLTNANPFRVEADGKLIAEKFADLFPDPHLEATHSIAKIERTPDGKTTLTVNTKFAPRLGSGASVSITGIGMTGEGRELHVTKVSSGSGGAT